MQERKEAVDRYIKLGLLENAKDLKHVDMEK